MHRMTWKVSHSHALGLVSSPFMYRIVFWPLTVINDYPTECTIGNLLVVAASASRSSAACTVYPCFWTCLWRLYLHQSLAAWLGVCHPHSWLCRSSAGIAFSLHLAEPVDWLLYEYRLGEMCNATFVRLLILLWTGSLIFPKAMHSVWQGLLNNMHAFSRASKKWSFCIHMPEWELCMCSLERNSENVCMCVSKFQMYSIYQPHYPYVINEHQNFQPYSKQFSC